MNYYMHDMNKSITEFHGTPKTTEENIHKTNIVLLVKTVITKVGKGKKAKSKPKGPKTKSQLKGKEDKTSKSKRKDEKDSVSHHCSKIEHWKRHCAVYLEDIKKNGGTTSASGAKK